MDENEMLMYATSLLGEYADAQVLKRILKSTALKVKRYTKRDELCDGLSLLICEIAADRYRAFKPGQDEIVQIVSSVSDGDQSVSFKAPKSAQNSLQEFTHEEKQMLNEWRKLF